MACNERNKVTKEHLQVGSKKIYEVVKRHAKEAFKSEAVRLAATKEHTDAMEEYERADKVRVDARKVYEAAEKKLNAIERRLGIEAINCWDESGEKTTREWRAHYDKEVVPQATMKKLVRYDELRMLGQHKEARELRAKILRDAGIE